MLTQGKDDNEAGRKKDKLETANLSDREYNYFEHLFPAAAMMVMLETSAPSGVVLEYIGEDYCRQVE